jgi:glutamate--cysteine ligase
MDKLRVSMGISSFVTAMIANSPITEGKPNGFMSRRAYIWLNTDPDRCGLIRRAFSQDFGFNDYVEYVANVPMMFIKREGKWIPFYGITFKNYIEKGYKGYFPILEDWELHLTTIFTEVRIKQYLEVRGGDAPPPRLILSIPTLLKGILYNHESRNAAWRLVKDFRWEERLKLQRDVSKYALDARVKNNKVLDLAKELIAISKEGLKGEIRRKNHDDDESKYLSPLEELIFEDGTCPAALLMKEWERGLKRDPKKLIEYCSY